jgi:hypothetical protein
MYMIGKVLRRVLYPSLPRRTEMEPKKRLPLHPPGIQVTTVDRPARAFRELIVGVLLRHLKKL